MKEQLALLPNYLGAHLRLTIAALVVALGISVPLGVLVTRRRWLEGPVLGTASVLQTIPSLALLAVMVPLLAAAGFRSIGFLPAFFGLVLYSLLPILRNTMTGIRNVDPVCIEAARGVGMTPWQQLVRVEIPLAMPVIVAGVRTSTVWTVGMATLSTPVGAPSLGNYIFSGLQTRNFDAILVGCAAAAGLALVLDAIVRVVASGLMERRRGRMAFGLSAFLALGTAATIPVIAVRSAASERITIGSKTFTEQYILAEILGATVEANTPLVAESMQSLGSTVAFDALSAGSIDAYVEYSGTIWTTIMHRDAQTGDRAAINAEIRRELREAHRIVVVGTLGFENAYTLAMPRRRARELGIKSVSDLARVAAPFSMGGDYEFFSRPEWKALESKYGLRPASRRSMDPSLMYQAAAAGEVDVISAFSTDGRITALDLVVLDDEKGAIPFYDALLLVSSGFADRHPDALAALQSLIGTIDADAMRGMNLAVDRDHELPRIVAERFVTRLRNASTR